MTYTLAICAFVLLGAAAAAVWGDPRPLWKTLLGCVLMLACVAVLMVAQWTWEMETSRIPSPAPPPPPIFKG